MADGVLDGVIDWIGETPLVRLHKLSPEGGAAVLGKLESANPSASVKDRAALAMVLAAERDGTIGPGATIVEATSGNTGISLAMIAAVRGYRCVLVMPEDMSVARRLVLRSYGADVHLTQATDGMGGAVEEAHRIVRDTAGAWMPDQFTNPANPDIHESTTGAEIWKQTGGSVDAFVAGVGTGGTVTGVARALKRHNPGCLIVAVEPKASAVLSGGRPGLHGIQGLGAGFIPDVLDRSLLDEVMTVSDVEADRMMRLLGREEGLLLGPSAGANVHAAVELASRLSPEQQVVTILCDTGERYVC